MKVSKIQRRASDRPAILYTEWLLEHCKGLNSIYDIGAGDGAIKKHLPPSITYSGIDLGSDIYQRTDDVQYVEDPSALSQAVRRSKQSDLTILMDVLEHTETFTALFEDALSISSRYLFVSLPNELWLYNRVQFLFGKTVPCHSFEMLGKKPGHKHAWLVSIPEARRILNEVAQKYGFYPEHEVGQVFLPNNPIYRLICNPLNQLGSIDLMAQGWGCLWKKS